MKKTLVVIALVLMASAAFAQTTASGTLTVSGTVQGSMQLVFLTGGTPTSVPLGGSGTSAATLAFGPLAKYVTPAPTILQTDLGPGNGFSVETDFRIQVSASNTTSNYKLAVQGNAPVAGEPSFMLTSTDGTFPVDATSRDILTNGSFGTTTMRLKVVIPNAYTTGTISNSLGFLATAI